MPRPSSPRRRRPARTCSSGEAYRASGRSEQLLDTVAYHVYGRTSAERPWKQHPGSTRIAQRATELEATATVTVPPADVTELTLDVAGQASSARTAGTVSIWDWAVNAWFPVSGPLALGSVADRIVTWSTTSPQRFLGPAGDVRVRVRDTRGGSFVSRLDQLRVSATY